MIPVLRYYPLSMVEDSQLRYAVVIASCQEEWVLCRHRERDTWECPGGHIEPGETPLEAAARELYEETGAHADELMPVCVYSVQFGESPETFGLLCRARLSAAGPLPEGSEMACVRLFDTLPENWTYPYIQPFLLRHAAAF